MHVERIELSGNTVYGDATLLNLLQNETGTAQDLAGLQAMGNRISRFYRENGYPFAQAFLPRQDLSQGTLRMTIIEGRYGEVSTRSENAALAADVAPTWRIYKRAT
ncbi:hypothetical protein HORIV_08460 [Vreelandella olivaria]|uniref:POTRA domain-containing protein n=1 Tax=Vreelandella olivaria TaxID=390919 RepID=A0ABM7GD92_9GAMM|nr:hypothetical protein HORIV_08460 [Halomonas olivaria]